MTDMLTISIDDKPRRPGSDQISALAYRLGYTASFNGWHYVNVYDGGSKRIPVGEAGVRDPKTGHSIVVQAETPEAAIVLLLTILERLVGR